MSLTVSSVISGITSTIYDSYKYYTGSPKNIEVQIPKLLEEPCAPIHALTNILSTVESDSLTGKTFKILNETQGISLENYLPWKAEYMGPTGYIDYITPDQLQKSVMWGIDEAKRPYIVFNYTCDSNKEGMLTLFQRYTDIGRTLTTSDHYRAEGCSIISLNPIYNSEGFLGNLTALVKGKEIASKNFMSETFSSLNLAK